MLKEDVFKDFMVEVEQDDEDEWILNKFKLIKKYHLILTKYNLLYFNF